MKTEINSENHQIERYDSDVLQKACLKDLSILERKYSIAILLFLVKNGNTMPSKRAIQMYIAKDRTVFTRITELTEAGLITCSRAHMYAHNSWTVDLTDLGKKIADKLIECESYLEGVQ